MGRWNKTSACRDTCYGPIVHMVHMSYSPYAYGPIHTYSTECFSMKQGEQQTAVTAGMGKGSIIGPDLTMEMLKQLCRCDMWMMWCLLPPTL